MLAYTTRAHNGLSTALGGFQRILTADQTAQLHSFSSHAPTPDDVVRLTQQITEVNASRKSRLFASRLQGLLSSIQQYCKIIDICVGPNQIAALVWSGIRLVLLVSSKFAEYFDKLSKLVAQLSNYCPRLSEYEKLFPISVRLQQALADFYAIIVQFCSKALGVVQENGIIRYSKSIWKSFKVEFKEIEENISEAKNEVTEELRLASEQEAASFRRLLTAEADKSRAFRVIQFTEIQENQVFRSQQALALQQSDARQIHKILAEEERKKIRLLRLIPNYDYAASLRWTKALCCAGTCSWLLRKSEFKKWIDEAGSKHLWCYGIPGCGKTVLMGFIIDHLRTRFSSCDETVIIYYFFDSSKKISLKASSFLRCILHQAISLETLLPSFQRHLESIFVEQTEPAIDELEQLFLHFYGKFKNAFLLIDGLDETDEAQQRVVKSFLKEVQKMDGARILVSSHAAMDMSKVLTHGFALKIRPEDLKDDIKAFVQSQLDKYALDELSDCSSSALDLIKQKLTSDAEGMFLWAYLQLQAIVDVYEEHGTLNRIPDLLETLPRKLTDMYSFLLERLTRGSEDQADRAKKAFQWAVFSKQSLTIQELEEAISITTDQKSWRSPSSRLDIPRLARLCGNLINYDEANKTVSLAHHTVESFLLSCSGIRGVAHFAMEEARTEQYLADICLTYLSFTDFHKALTRTSDMRHVHAMDCPVDLVGTMLPSFMRRYVSTARVSRRGKRTAQPFDLVNVLRTELSVYQSRTVDTTFRLLEYCKSNWHNHSRYIDLHDKKRLKTVENFVRGTHLPKEWIPWSSIENKNSLPFWNMFIWAVENSNTIIFRVWQNIITIQESSYWIHLWQEEGQKLFAAACATANFEQLEIMLGAKERYDRMGRPSRSEISHELVRVCHLGHDGVVERLLQEKADVNAAAAKYDDGRTALQAAAGGGHLAVVERLLQEKADVNAAAAEYYGRTALQAAAGGGHKTVVECLRKAGAIK